MPGKADHEASGGARPMIATRAVGQRSGRRPPARLAARAVGWLAEQSGRQRFPRQVFGMQTWLSGQSLLDEQESHALSQVSRMQAASPSAVTTHPHASSPSQLEISPQLTPGQAPAQPQTPAQFVPSQVQVVPSQR